ncbi:hypothetical protein B0T42_02145 [Rathayibacter sp. VKM Ac-2630]|nr:hypothetical protein B0T42_02145 [Rathayibacter sp. VKM Ac-2630]
MALVAPQGTTPSFDTALARQSVESAGTFLSRETNGAVTVQVDRVVDWMYVDNDTPCSWAGTLQDWVQPRIGWQGGPGKHLVVMVPPGDPCPDWANGEQNWAVDAGGRSFVPGTDPSAVAHELGHNMSMFHSSSIGCDGGWDFSTLGAGVPANCYRTEYGNRLDVMGGAWTFNPFPAATLDRIGMLPRRYEPTCGAVRTLNATSVGAAAQAREAISFADPRDPAARYWVDFRAQADANIYNYLHGTGLAFKPNRDGVQITRNDPNQWDAPTVLSRPYDGDDHRQLTAVNERVTLGGGAWVEYKGTASNGEGVIDVFVPCRAFETTLIAQHSGLCLDNANWSSADGNLQAQYGCGTAAVQRFAFIRVPGVVNTYTIVNRHSGKCLDIGGASTTNGAAVQQWTCTGGTNQQFTLRAATYSGATAKDFQLIARHSSKCAVVTGGSTAAGAGISQTTCTSANQAATVKQAWRLTGA